jgi:hypothetical protein
MGLAASFMRAVGLGPRQETPPVSPEPPGTSELNEARRIGREGSVESLAEYSRQQKSALLANAVLVQGGIAAIQAERTGFLEQILPYFSHPVLSGDAVQSFAREFTKCGNFELAEKLIEQLRAQGHSYDLEAMRLAQAFVQANRDQDALRVWGTIANRVLRSQSGKEMLEAFQTRTAQLTEHSELNEPQPCWKAPIEEAFRERKLEAYAFLLKNLRTAEGKMQTRVWKEAIDKIDGMIEDGRSFQGQSIVGVCMTSEITPQEVKDWLLTIAAELNVEVPSQEL